jgi:hypothetical protein
MQCLLHNSAVQYTPQHLWYADLRGNREHNPMGCREWLCPWRVLHQMQTEGCHAYCGAAMDVDAGPGFTKGGNFGEHLVHSFWASTTSPSVEVHAEERLLPVLHRHGRDDTKRNASATPASAFAAIHFGCLAAYLGVAAALS